MACVLLSQFSIFSLDVLELFFGYLGLLHVLFYPREQIFAVEGVG